MKSSWIFRLHILLVLSKASAFSALGGGGIGLDRFRSTCPADATCILQFDASLVESTAPADASHNIWTAVYRSNQNQPSVFVRDEFFLAMNAATSSTSGGNAISSDDASNQDQNSMTSSPSANSEPIDEKLETPMALEKPVAVAQLRKSPDFAGAWVLDSLRCGLKKENMDEACDGGSEYLEALSVGIDSLLLHHLTQQSDNENESGPYLLFEGAIRTKATLFSNKLFEDRGFLPVEELSKDMATHVSSLDGCLEKYAARSVDTSLNPGARDRALQIVSLLGQLDRNEQLDAAQALQKATEDEKDDEEDFDPWANIKMQI